MKILIIGQIIRRRIFIESGITQEQKCHKYRLEGFKTDYKNSHDGQEWDMPDTSDLELEVTAKVQVNDFMATLTEKDKQILRLRMDGYTLEEVANKAGFHCYYK